MAQEAAQDDANHDSELGKHPTRTIRYADEIDNRGRVGRRDSRDAISIRSVSRHRTVEPNVVLPVQFRTLSFNIEEAKTREPEKSVDSKEKEIEFLDLDWHVISVNELLNRLSTSKSQGLSVEQAERRLKEYGRNAPTPPPSRWFRKTIGYLFGGFGSVLLVASVLVFIAWKPLGQPPAIANLALGIVLAIVWLIQACFAVFQDWSSSRVMSSISNMLPDECTLIRDGRRQQILGSEIVPGDVIHITMGNKLPADLRFIDCSPDAKFDRSILTGEALPIRGSIDSTDDNYLETACIGLAGTHCVSGSATGVVVATGDRSVFGRLAKLTSTPKTGLTNLEREIYHFVALIVSIMIIMIVIVLIVWATWLRHSHPDWIDVPVLIVDCVSVAVAFIPEGLPIAVTASLTITASVMKKNKILCKSLKTVETLGSVSVICSDKTGTLTKNQMTVTDCLVGNASMHAYSAAGIVELSQREAVPQPLAKSLSRLALMSGLCNAGEFDAATAQQPLEMRKIMGDATDQAILRFAESLSSVEAMRNEWKCLYTLAFNSKNKFMIKIMQRVLSGNVEKSGLGNTQSDEAVLTMKGAPDILLPRCTSYIDNDGLSKPMTDEHRAYVENIKDEMSREAKRVILLAQKVLPESIIQMDHQSREFEDEIMNQSGAELQLVGLLGIVDPPRDEIPEVIRTLRGAGIKVFMVTGDFRLTAQAIAYQCGIITKPIEEIEDVSALNDDLFTVVPSKRAIVLSGAEMMALDKDQWDGLSTFQEIVFARTTPEQKLRIVKELQAREEVVGMTGDGVNDAPSLKQADIGIAMGSGSDIAIEASDMVLLDSFAAIVEAVKYGRVVFENLRKTICYLLPAGSFSEFWPVMTNVLFGLPQILSSFLMIIICCFTDCAAAIAIAYEKPEADVLLQPPRDIKKTHLVDWKLILHAYGVIGVMETVLSFTMSYWYAERKGIPFGTLWFGFGQMPDGMSTDTYTSILKTASSIYFVNLVVMQWFNLFAVRTRRLSILQHPPLFSKRTSNKWLFPTIIFSLLIAVFFLYVRKFQESLATAPAPTENWFLPMAFGMGILLFDEARKWAARRYPQGIVAKMAW